MLGDRYDEAEVLANIGETRYAAGGHAAAVAGWRDALTIFDQLGHPDAERLRERLAAAKAPPYARPAQPG